MPTPTNASAGELFIVDHTDHPWKELKPLSNWTESAIPFDTAAGFFEIV
jgi:hypothetical protein